MRFSVKTILNTPGKELPFQFAMDLSQVNFGGRYPVSDPVTVTGSVRNTAGILELSLTAQTVLNCTCDRCLKPFRREKQISFSCLLAQEKQNEENEEIVLLEDGEFVDLEDLARTAWILEMDTKLLCSEDCRGLCPRCGADLNLGPCSCKKEPDPRLAVLAKLLENKNRE
ncbi:MAG: DUF177 domain-containing protein [Oscillibacter sp.]|jgi:uncharacterized protein|nr:DUF177 domain-containing protein [Oscillibacter sp.]